MKKKYAVVIACGLLLSSSACVELPEDDLPESNDFFDLSEYFEQESQRLMQEVSTIEKQITIGETTEEETIQNLNFEKELAVFINSDINKSSWLDKYTVDSTLNQANELTQLVYTAQDEKLKTKMLRITFENGTVKGIEIQNASGTRLARLKQDLSYQPDKGYTIESHQDIMLFEDRRMRIEAEFLQ